MLHSLDSTESYSDRKHSESKIQKPFRVHYTDERTSPTNQRRSN